MAAVLADQDLGELGGVGEVAVVPEADAVGRIDVEGLRLGGAVAAGGRVAHVADADVALQLEHVVLLEHVAHQAAALAHVELALGRGRDAGGILAAVLQHGERVVEPLIDRAGADDADDAAHGCSLSPSYLDVATLCGHVHPRPPGSAGRWRSTRRTESDASRRHQRFRGQVQQLPEDHEHPEQQEAAQQPEGEAQRGGPCR